LEIQCNKYIASSKLQNEVNPSNICDFEFLLVEHEQESGEFFKIDIPKSAYYDGNVLDKNFFSKLIGIDSNDKYKVRILDHNVIYLHIDHTQKILLFKDHYLLEITVNEEKQVKEQGKKQEEKHKEDSDGFEEFTDMNFH
jgi:hypothetical protein